MPAEICGVDLQVQGDPRLFIALKWTLNHVFGFRERKHNQFGLEPAKDNTSTYITAKLSFANPSQNALQNNDII